MLSTHFSTPYCKLSNTIFAHWNHVYVLCPYSPCSQHCTWWYLGAKTTIDGKSALQIWWSKWKNNNNNNHKSQNEKNKKTTTTAEFSSFFLRTRHTMLYRLNLFIRLIRNVCSLIFPNAFHSIFGYLKIFF